MPSETKKITFDTAALFFGKVVGVILGVVRLNYLAVYLGVANFGILNFALSYVSLFQVLFDFGLTQLLARDLSRDLTQSPTVVGKTIIFKIIIVIIASLIIISGGLFSSFEYVTFWAIFLSTVSFAINGISMVFLGALQAHRMMKFISLYYILNDLLLSILVILLIAKSPYVVTILMLTVVVCLINLLILYFIYRQKIGIPRLIIDLPFWKTILKGSTPIALSSLGISMYTFIGPTILKYVRTDSEVGIFWSGYKIISILTLIPMSFSQVVYPLFSRFYVQAKEKLEKALADSLRVMVLIAVPFAFCIILTAQDVFKLVYTPAYYGGIIVLRIAIVGNVFGYMDWILYTYILAINRQRYLMVQSIMAGIMAIIMSILFIPAGGYIALPVIQLTIELALFISQIFYLNHLGNNSFSLRLFIKPLISSVIGLLFLFAFSDINLFIKVPIFMLLYFSFMLIFKGFGDQEKETIQSAIGKLTGYTQ
jgi:O-antigen/teichoic acid export membrane protein